MSKKVKKSSASDFDEDAGSVFSEKDLRELGLKKITQDECRFYFIELNKKKVINRLSSLGSGKRDVVFFNPTTQRYICKCRMNANEGQTMCFKHIDKATEDISDCRRINLEDFNNIEKTKNGKPIVSNNFSIIVTTPLKNKATQILRKINSIREEEQTKTTIVPELSVNFPPDDLVSESIDISSEDSEESEEDENSLEVFVTNIPDLFVDSDNHAILLDDNGKGSIIGYITPNPSGNVIINNVKYSVIHHNK